MYQYTESMRKGDSSHGKRLGEKSPKRTPLAIFNIESMHAVKLKNINEQITSARTLRSAESSCPRPPAQHKRENKQCPLFIY